MIFIGYNYSGKVISIVNAKSKELAEAFWQGRKLNVNTIKSLQGRGDFIPLDEHPTGVYPILETIEKEEYIQGKKRKFICVK